MEKSGWETKVVDKSISSSVITHIHPAKTGWVVDVEVDRSDLENFKGWKKLIPYSELFPKDIHPFWYEKIYGLLYADLMYLYRGDEIKNLPITGR